MEHQRTFFDAEIEADMDAKACRDRSIEQVEANNFDWAAEFRRAILRTATSQAWITSDDVLRKFPDLESCPEKRVIGAAFMRLSREGVIEAGGYTSSDRVKSHARPKRQWRLKP